MTREVRADFDVKLRTRVKSKMRVETCDGLQLVQRRRRALGKRPQFLFRQVAVTALNRFEFIDKIHQRHSSAKGLVRSRRFAECSRIEHLSLIHISEPTRLLSI